MKTLSPWPCIATLLLALCVCLVLRNFSEIPNAKDRYCSGSKGRSLGFEAKSRNTNSEIPATLSKATHVTQVTATVEPAPLPVPGSPVSFLLSDIDPSLLTEEEDSALYEVQEKFAEALSKNPVSDVSSPEYHRQWKKAQLHCDDLLRLRLGAEGFNRMNFMASQEVERIKK